MRVPFYFGSVERRLFGFFHPAEGDKSRGAGVLLCSPFGTDQTRSAQAYRHLAERLAAAGFPCLRFDPFGTGDSGGDERSPELVSGWISDIGVAADELRSRSGATEIALVGLRLGATLAMVHAANQRPVDSLVLWNPLVTGAGFLEEITRLHTVYMRVEPQLAIAPPSAPIEGGREALGTLFPDALQADLSKLDLLRTTTAPSRKTLVIDGGNVAGRDGLMAHLQKVGAGPELRSHPGHKFLTTVSHRALVPDEVLTSIVGWLSEAHPLRSRPAAQSAATSMEGPASERPVTFGGGGGLFGILTPASPTRASPSHSPIVLANAGCVNRCGPHRLYVRMARRWAALGHDVLRMDLSGIGDSPVAAGVKENLAYPPSALAELEEAIRFLGSRPTIVAGLCSGGDHAFQMGAHSSLVRGAWLLNPRTFCVLDLAAVESTFGDAPSSTPVENVPRALRAMAERGTETLLVVSRNDPGVAYVDAHAADEMGALGALPRFHRVDLDGADHPFTPVAVQEQVINLLAAQLEAAQAHRRP